MRHGALPIARAASTKSSAFTASVVPRVNRTNTGVAEMPIAIIAFVRLGPRNAASAIARIRKGQASSASVIREISMSVLPPAYPASSPAGTPIKSPNAGRVVLARNLYYTGNTVIIDHGLGLFSYFAHLSETAVTEGQDVTTGAIVGKVGATGRVTGPNLHWTVRISGARVDPLSLLAILGEPVAGRLH